MIASQKLSATKYLMTRENAGWEFRVIVVTDSAVEIGISYTLKNKLEIESITSLCEICAELSGYEYEDDMVFSEEQKQDALAVLADELEQDEYQEYYN